MLWLAVMVLGQDAPYAPDELQALRTSIETLVREGRMLQAEARIRELDPRRIPPGALPDLQALDRRVWSYAALLRETSSGDLGAVPTLTRVTVKGGGRPLGRVIRQDATAVHLETVTGIRTRLLKAQIETMAPLGAGESAAEVQAELKRQAGNRGLVPEPSGWKELAGRKATAAQLFGIADFAARNGLGEALAPLFDLALKKDAKILDQSHAAKGVRLVNQLLYALTVNQLPQAKDAYGQLAVRYRDTPVYRDRLHPDKEVGELLQVILKKDLPAPRPSAPPRLLAAVPSPEPAPVPPPAAPTAVVPPPAAPAPPPADRSVPVTARALPSGTAPEILAQVSRGDALFEQAMRHLLASDPNENPDGWGQENAKALEHFTRALQDCYLPAQDRFPADVPRAMLDRVRETTLRASLCRKRSVMR